MVCPAGGVAWKRTVFFPAGESSLSVPFFFEEVLFPVVVVFFFEEVFADEEFFFLLPVLFELFLFDCPFPLGSVAWACAPPEEFFCFFLIFFLAASRIAVASRFGISCWNFSRILMVMSSSMVLLVPSVVAALARSRAVATSFVAFLFSIVVGAASIAASLDMSSVACLILSSTLTRRYSKIGLDFVLSMRMRLFNSSMRGV